MTEWKHSKNRRTKFLAVKYKGGKCEICGYDKNPMAMDFHHVNSTEKKYNIAQIRHRTWNFLKHEIDKCLLLCALCHRELENPMMEDDWKIYNSLDANVISRTIRMRSIQRVNIKKHKTKNPKTKYKYYYKRCADCGVVVNSDSIRCWECYMKMPWKKTPARLVWYASRRKVKDRPAPDVLLKEIAESNMTRVAKKYGVCFKTILKWLK
jgi:hypothetical protein